MKYVKTLGLASMAVTTLMAFAGEGGASAAILCKVEGTGAPTGTTCPAEKAYPAGTEIKANLVAGTKVVLATSFKTIECSKSSLSGKTEVEGSSILAVTVDIPQTEIAPKQFVWDLSFSECNCEVVVLVGGFLVIEQISGSHNGTLRSSLGEFTTTCSTIFGPVHCIYETHGTDLGIVKGGSPAKLEVKEASIPRAATSSLCSEKAFWTATYEVTTPNPLFVASHT